VGEEIQHVDINMELKWGILEFGLNDYEKGYYSRQKHHGSAHDIVLQLYMLHMLIREDQ